MIEEVLATARANPKIDPGLAIWGWDVAVYLYLGGLTAGILVISSLLILTGRDDKYPFAGKKLPLWAPILLSIGMGALFLDLEHKLYVWRFYTTFQPASPMSWGSWILILIYPVSIMLILGSLREAYPTLARWLEKIPGVSRLTNYCTNCRMPAARWGVILGVFLGFYTGILLSAFSARPFWNTGFLAPLFLVSGLSTAAALALIGARGEAERHFFTRADIVLIVLELSLIALLLVNLSTGTGVQIAAADRVVGGDYTIPFWVYFVLPGLLVPAFLEYWELAGKKKAWFYISPLLILYGGYMLRHLTVNLGQASTWSSYATQFNPDLLKPFY